MKLLTNFKVTVSYESRALASWEKDHPQPEYPSVSTDQIDPLIERLKAAGVKIDREKSEKKLSNDGIEIQANFDEKTEGNLKELVFVSCSGMSITVHNYSNHHSNGRMGGFSTNTGGIEARLVYECDNLQQGEKLLDKAKQTVQDFYQSMCHYKVPAGLPKMTFKKRQSTDDYSQK